MDRVKIHCLARNEGQLALVRKAAINYHKGMLAKADGRFPWTGCIEARIEPHPDDFADVLIHPHKGGHWGNISCFVPEGAQLISEPNRTWSVLFEYNGFRYEVYPTCQGKMDFPFNYVPQDTRLIHPAKLSGAA